MACPVPVCLKKLDENGNISIGTSRELGMNEVNSAALRVSPKIPRPCDSRGEHVIERNKRPKRSN